MSLWGNMLAIMLHRHEVVEYCRDCKKEHMLIIGLRENLLPYRICPITLNDWDVFNSAVSFEEKE